MNFLIDRRVKRELYGGGLLSLKVVSMTSRGIPLGD